MSLESGRGVSPDFKTRIGSILGVDAATLFGSISVLWTVLSGLLTLALIASRFDPAAQGYYYTFGSLLELTVLAELGLGIVIQQFASHEWSGLRLEDSGSIAGERGRLGRLASLAVFAFRWYAVAGTLASISLAIAGYVFFSQREAPGIQWQTPWFALCALTGARLLTVPAFSLLDGCDQMRSSNRIRLAASVTSSLCGWAALVLEAGLWVPAVMSGAGSLTSLTLLFKKHARFFASLCSDPSGDGLAWRREIWPMQWRIALSWLSGYLIFSLFTPVMFHFHGSAVAGQMGMTLSAVYSLQTLALTWVTTRVPRFAVHIARREFDAADELFSFASRRSVAVFCAGAAGFLLALMLLLRLRHPMAGRFLGLVPVLLFLGAALLTVYAGGLAAYLRAHKREPFLVPSVLGGALTALGTLYFGSRYGPSGAAGSYLTLNLLFLIPEIAIFRHCKTRWHGRSEA